MAVSSKRRRKRTNWRWRIARLSWADHLIGLDFGHEREGLLRTVGADRVAGEEPSRLRCILRWTGPFSLNEKLVVVRQRARGLPANLAQTPERFFVFHVEPDGSESGVFRFTTAIQLEQRSGVFRPEHGELRSGIIAKILVADRFEEGDGGVIVLQCAQRLQLYGKDAGAQQAFELPETGRL